MCDWKFEIKKMAVRHNDWWVEYVDASTFKNDNYCDTCEKTEQQVCAILNHFDVIKQKREELIEQKIRKKLWKTKKELWYVRMKLTEDVRLLLQQKINNDNNDSEIISVIDHKEKKVINEDINEDKYEDYWDTSSKIVYIDTISRREKIKKKKLLWEEKYWKISRKN